MKKIFKFIKNLLVNIVKDDFPGMASEMAFNFIFALFPFLIFLVAIFGLIGTESQISQILVFMEGFVPSDVMRLIEGVLRNVISSSSSGGILTIGLFIALFAASNATAVMIKGINKAFNVTETRPIWYTRWLAIVLVIMNAMVMFLGINLIIFGKLILFFIVRFFNFSPELANMVLLIRWPIAFSALYLVTFLNYYFMPNIGGDNRVRILSALPGSMFFCVFWLLASWVFGLYVDNFGVYNKVYGTLGVFVVLMLWLYYTSLVILIGGEINSIAYKRLYAEEGGNPPAIRFPIFHKHSQ